MRCAEGQRAQGQLSMTEDERGGLLMTAEAWGFSRWQQWPLVPPILQRTGLQASETAPRCQHPGPGLGCPLTESLPARATFQPRRLVSRIGNGDLDEKLKTAGEFFRVAERRAPLEAFDWVAPWMALPPLWSGRRGSRGSQRTAALRGRAGGDGEGPAENLP